MCKVSEDSLQRAVSMGSGLNRTRKQDIATALLGVANSTMQRAQQQGEEASSDESNDVTLLASKIENRVRFVATVSQVGHIPVALEQLRLPNSRFHVYRFHSPVRT